MGGTAPVNPSLLSLFERRLKPSNHVGMSICEAAASEASLRSQSEALSHSMWVLSALLAFMRLQNFTPEDSSLFNTLVTSLSRSLAHQASLTATHNQPPGTPSGPLRCSRFSAGPSGSFGVSLCGQHDSSVLSAETRRYSLLHSEHRLPDRSPSLRGPLYSASFAVHSGPPEFSCGLSQSPLAGLGLKMDPLSSGVSGVAFASGWRPSTCSQLP